MARINSFMIKNFQLATFLLRYVGMITMTRARGDSVYCRDPDGSLIEIATR
jgi:hypothetical protein